MLWCRCNLQPVKLHYLTKFGSCLGIPTKCFFGFLGCQIVESGHWELSDNGKKLRKIGK